MAGFLFTVSECAILGSDQLHVIAAKAKSVVASTADAVFHHYGWDYRRGAGAGVVVVFESHGIAWALISFCGEVVLPATFGGLSRFFRISGRGAVPFSF